MSQARGLEQFDITGRVAVVTGASSGIGVAMAECLAAAGAKLAIVARRLDRLETLAARLEGAGAKVLPVAADVSREEDVDALVERVIGHFGRADVLVNNAGVTNIAPAELEALDDYRRVLDVNLVGVFLCAQRFGRRMLEAGRGSIVNVASVLGSVAAGQVPQASYASSKAGVVNLSRELGTQWARRGVRVNCIAPGWFPTEMTEEMFGDEKGLTWMRRRTPMGRGGELHELDGALLFLASDASSFITGHVITVDGGWTVV